VNHQLPGGVAFSPDGSKLAAANFGDAQSGLIKVWDSRTLQQYARFSGSGFSFSPDGLSLASISSGLPIIAIWDMTTRFSAKSLLIQFAHPTLFTCLSYSPDGTWLALIDPGQTINLRNATTGRHMQSLGPIGLVTSATFSPDGKQLAACGPDGTVVLWDAATGQTVGTLNGTRQALQCFAFSPDGRILATGNSDNTLTL